MKTIFKTDALRVVTNGDRPTAIVQWRKFYHYFFMDEKFAGPVADSVLPVSLSIFSSEGMCF